MDPYLRLAGGIVRQAIRDYLEFGMMHLNVPSNKEYKEAVEEIEEFFLSDWFYYLCDLDGERLLRMLKRHVQKEFKKSCREAEEAAKKATALVESRPAPLMCLEQEVAVAW